MRRGSRGGVVVRGERYETVVGQRFGGDVAEHEMHVLLDVDGYRHLRFRAAKSVAYWFDIVCWPGVLAIHGDCGTYVWARERDMFAWFGKSGGRINPRYWAEKLQAPRGSHRVEEYSEQEFVARMREWCRDLVGTWEDEHRDGMRDVRDGFGGDCCEYAAYEGFVWEAVERELCGWNLPRSEGEAHELLANHEVFGDVETWEWEFRGWQYQYLWCCHAVRWGIERYYASRGQLGASREPSDGREGDGGAQEALKVMVAVSHDDEVAALESVLSDEGRSGALKALRAARERLRREERAA